MSQVNLEKMIEIVFSQPPSEPKSYKLDLSVGEDINNDGNSNEVEDSEKLAAELAKTTANVLMNILISGCQILFGTSVNPSNISEEQFKTINKYINSFGYETHYEYTYTESTNESGETIKKPSNLNVYFTALN